MWDASFVSLQLCPRGRFRPSIRLTDTPPQNHLLVHQRPRDHQRPVRCRRRRGAASVEMAFVAPVVLIMIFATVELGRSLMVQQALTNASREGCRTAVLGTTTNATAAESKVRDYLQKIIRGADDPSIVQVRMTPSSLSNIAPGTPITVETEVAFADISWLPINWVTNSGDSTISARVTQRRE